MSIDLYNTLIQLSDTADECTERAAINYLEEYLKKYASTKGAYSCTFITEHESWPIKHIEGNITGYHELSDEIRTEEGVPVLAKHILKLVEESPGLKNSYEERKIGAAFYTIYTISWKE